MQAQSRPIQAGTRKFLIPLHRNTHQNPVKLLLFISNAFINTMGITQPSPQAANRAAWFIFAMLSAVVAAIVTIVFVALRLATHH
jgi:ABC-type amino acid transport system permease subunit